MERQQINLYQSLRDLTDSRKTQKTALFLLLFLLLPLQSSILATNKQQITTKYQKESALKSGSTANNRKDYVREGKELLILK
ncbi:MAG: hypothetical protein ISR54_10030 [Chlorobium phaeobacteroides]|nr:hypothetical protein [Chlorobium phaeobacteroides]